MRRLLVLLLPLGLAGCALGGGGGMTLGTSPNGGSQVRGAQAQKVTVQLASENAAGVSGTAVLHTAGSQKTRVDVSLSRKPAQQTLTVDLEIGTCAKKLALRPEWVLGRIESTHASWRTPARLGDLISAQTAVVVRSGTAKNGGPIAACGEVKG